MLSEFDKQVIWTVSLLAFWSASRLGELISSEQSSIDFIRAITWGKVNLLADNHITILIAIPKVTEDHSPEGHVIDLFSFDDSRYCPVYNLDKLHDFCLAKNKGENCDCAFLWQSGHILTLRVMNEYLNTFLSPFLGDLNCKYSCHSFRSGLPSFMANHPSEFSEEDIMCTGRWTSPVVKRYLRVKGVSQKKIMKKIHKVLSR